MLIHRAVRPRQWDQFKIFITVSPPGTGVWLLITTLPCDIGDYVFAEYVIDMSNTCLMWDNMRIGTLQILPVLGHPQLNPGFDGTKMYIDSENMLRSMAKMYTPRRLLPCLSESYKDDVKSSDEEDDTDDDFDFEEMWVAWKWKCLQKSKVHQY